MKKQYKRNKRGQFTKNTLIGTRAFFTRTDQKPFDGMVIHESADQKTLIALENTTDGCFNAGYGREVNLGKGESMNVLGVGKEVVEMFERNLREVLHHVTSSTCGVGMAKDAQRRIKEILEKNLYAQ